MMKKILCFGDSNTYGFVPQTCKRYEKNERWSGILSEILGSGYAVLEEGMNNRTGFFKNPESVKLCGKEYLPIFLQNHHDIDICVLSLGTNDSQFFYDLDENTVREGLQSLINSIKEVNPSTKIIVVPPVKIQANILNGNFVMLFDLTSVEKIAKTFHVYREVADQNGCYYLDFNDTVKPSETDGLHYSVESHRIIACQLAAFIKLYDL